MHRFVIGATVTTVGGGLWCYHKCFCPNSTSPSSPSPLKTSTILIYGPPGVGKTRYASTVLGAADVHIRLKPLTNADELDNIVHHPTPALHQPSQPSQPKLTRVIIDDVVPQTDWTIRQWLTNLVKDPSRNKIKHPPLQVVITTSDERIVRELEPNVTGSFKIGEMDQNTSIQWVKDCLGNKRLSDGLTTDEVAWTLYGSLGGNRVQLQEAVLSINDRHSLSLSVEQAIQNHEEKLEDIVQWIKKQPVNEVHEEGHPWYDGSGHTLLQDLVDGKFDILGHRSEIVIETLRTTTDQRVVTTRRERQHHLSRHPVGPASGTKGCFQNDEQLQHLNHC